MGEIICNHGPGCQMPHRPRHTTTMRAKIRGKIEKFHRSVGKIRVEIAQFLGLRAIGHRSCDAEWIGVPGEDDVESVEVAFGHHQFETFERGKKRKSCGRSNALLRREEVSDSPW